MKPRRKRQWELVEFIAVEFPLMGNGRKLKVLVWQQSTVTRLCDSLINCTLKLSAISSLFSELLLQENILIMHARRFLTIRQCFNVYFNRHLTLHYFPAAHPIQITYLRLASLPSPVATWSRAAPSTKLRHMERWGWRSSIAFVFGFVSWTSRLRTARDSRHTLSYSWLPAFLGSG